MDEYEKEQFEMDDGNSFVNTNQNNNQIKSPARNSAVDENDNSYEDLSQSPQITHISPVSKKSNLTKISSPA
jgi:hypothetical protein